jgi:hypothetical protein
MIFTLIYSGGVQSAVKDLYDYPDILLDLQLCQPLLDLPGVDGTRPVARDVSYTVEKFAPFSYELLHVLLNCGEKFYQCKSEHKPGTTFGHIVFTAAYFY